MTNDQIESLFIERLKKSSYYFSNWDNCKLCTKDEIDLFTNWLNQLNEDDICFYLKEDLTILKSLTYQTKELCELAIRTNPYSIADIRDQTVDLCILALELSKSCHVFVRIVPNPDYKTTLKNLKKKKAILEALK